MTATGYVGGDPNKVNRSGDTMTGPLVLSGAPTIPLHAATKAYVDSAGTGIPFGTVTTKGDLIVATGNATVTRRPVSGVNGRVLTEDNTQADGVSWQSPSGGMDQTYPIAGYNFVAASGDPDDYFGVAAAGNNTIFWRRCWIPAGKIFSKLYVAVRDAGTWDGVTAGNQLAYFDDSGNPVNFTPDDGTLWTTNGWRGGTIAGGPYTSPSSGMFVYFGMICKGMTLSPNLAFPSGANDNNVPWYTVGPGVTKRRSFFQGSGSYPGSFDPTSSGTATTFGPLFGVAT